MKISCPFCEQPIEAGEEWIGHSMTCPACGLSFPVAPRPTDALNAPKAPPPPRVAPMPHGNLRIPGQIAPQSLGPLPEYTRRRRRGGGGKGLLVILILLIAGLAFAMVHFRQSPQQLWQRLLALVQGAQPATPVAEATPAPAAATPRPTAAPVSTPAPVEIDPIAWLLQHRNYYPKQVILSRETTFPAVIDGKVAGSVQAPAGTAVALYDIVSGSAGVVYNGGGARVAIDATDLRARATAAMATAAADEARAAQAARMAEAATPAIAAPAAGENTAAAKESAGAATSVTTFPAAGNRIPETISSGSHTEEDVARHHLVMTGTCDLHITGTAGLLAGTVINLASPDAWVYFDNLRPSDITTSFLDRFWVRGAHAAVDENMRVAQYGRGAIVIPQAPDYAAMTVYGGESFSGPAKGLQSYTKYDDSSLGTMRIASFHLEHGYEATIAQNADGTGISKNFVAADHDIDVPSLGSELSGGVHFVRIFPWRWVIKKGVAGGIFQNLNVGWYYNWNISDRSGPDLEYVPIKQKKGWPGLDRDWRELGATNLLGFNEPDHKDQSNLTVDQAIAAWPELLSTGLRVGSPAPSDGGLGWLYDFINKADFAHLRVDFVAVHYYRAVAGNNPQSAANSLYNFLKGVHDHVKRPLWVTEWNNGANWTGNDPTYAQEKACVEAMIKMMDRTPWVERYAIYNWVKDVRNVQRKDNTLTPAGEVYRDDESNVAPMRQGD